MDHTTEEIDYANRVLASCVEHGRTLLALQVKGVEAEHYDFVPAFQQQITDLFLVGLMWRFGEQFDLPTSARDRAFASFMHILVTDGLSMRAAKRRMQEAYRRSRDNNGEDTLAIHIGYETGTKEGALVAVFDQYRNLPGVSGAPFRLLARSRPIAAIVALAAIAISLLVGENFWVALGIGTVVGVSVLCIALAMYKQAINPSNSWWSRV